MYKFLGELKFQNNTECINREILSGSSSALYHWILPLGSLFSLHLSPPRLKLDYFLISTPRSLLVILFSLSYYRTDLHFLKAPGRPWNPGYTELKKQSSTPTALNRVAYPLFHFSILMPSLNFKPKKPNHHIGAFKSSNFRNSFIGLAIDTLHVRHWLQCYRCAGAGCNTSLVVLCSGGT